MSAALLQQHEATVREEWRLAQTEATKVCAFVGQLACRETGFIVSLFGRCLINCGPLATLQILAETREKLTHSVAMSDVRAVLDFLVHDESVASSGMCRVDVGEAVVAFCRQAGKGGSLGGKAITGEDEARCLRSVLDAQRCAAEAASSTSTGGGARSRDVVLFGFGRIGRLLARLLLRPQNGAARLRLRAIVVRPKKGVPVDVDLAKRLSLLVRDSVHGRFPCVARVDSEHSSLVVNGQQVQLIYAAGPDKVDYEAFGITDALVVDNTGVWRDEAGLGRHLKSRGVGQVLLTAPGKGDIPNIVAGVNCAAVIPSAVAAGRRIFSAASCSTNAVVPFLKLMDEAAGIVSGHLETVHAVTNDQNINDNFHKKDRRGRSAMLNMVLTSTGAGVATGKALPSLQGKLTASAIRVPTPDVSMAVLLLNLTKAMTAAEINALVAQASAAGPLRAQIGIESNSELVSTDLVGSSYAGVLDANNTVTHGARANLYVWYDNECGYSNQVIRVMQKLADATPPRTTTLRTVEDVELEGRRVVVRADFNVPLDASGKITDTLRIDAALKTIRYILSKKPKRLVMISHLGRPKGQVVEALSLRPVHRYLADKLGVDIEFVPGKVDQSRDAFAAPVVLFDNIRFNPEEEAKDGTTPAASQAFRRYLTGLCDVFVSEAFGTFHRAHASIVGIAAAVKVPGYLVHKEIRFLRDALAGGDGDGGVTTAIVGGAKVHDKLKLLRHIIPRVDHLIIGGGMAFTFLKHRGRQIGTSLFDAEGFDSIPDLLAAAEKHGTVIHLPVDVVCSAAFSNDGPIVTAATGDVPDGMMGLDVGPASVAAFNEVVSQSTTLLWNGPLGVFEMSNFAAGSRGVMAHVAARAKAGDLCAVVGGGDTTACCAKFGLDGDMTHVSTGGGASLQLIEGSPLPGLQALLS